MLLPVHFSLNVFSVSLLAFCVFSVIFTLFSPSAFTVVFSLHQITVTPVAPTKSLPEPQQAKRTTVLKTEDPTLKELESRAAKAVPESQVPAAVKQTPQGNV